MARNKVQYQNGLSISSLELGRRLGVTQKLYTFCLRKVAGYSSLVKYMCQFEDFPIISKYTRQQAVDDGILVQIMTYEDKPVLATTHLSDNFGLSELFGVWHEFSTWKTDVEPGLPEEERLFSTVRNEQQIWVIEDAESYTLMYPEDY